MIHCTAGKDRTGFACALILHALGVPEEVIAEDYLLTNRYYQRDPSASPTCPTTSSTRSARSTPRYLDAAFDAVGRDYGDVEAYLRDGLKLGAAERTALKERYLQA